MLFYLQANSLTWLLAITLTWKMKIFEILNVTLNLTFKWTQNEVKLIDLELRKSNLIEFQSPFLPISDPFKMISSVSNHLMASCKIRCSCHQWTKIMSTFSFRRHKYRKIPSLFMMSLFLTWLLDWNFGPPEVKVLKGELDEPRNYTLTIACIMNFKMQTLFNN